MADVLIVDDSDIFRASITGSLTDEGNTVRHASNGLDALRAISVKAPSIVLLDLDMPIMNGWETLHQLRGLGNSRSFPIVVTSFSDEVAVIERALRAGATDYFVKGDDSVKLLIKLKQNLRLNLTAFGDFKSDNEFIEPKILVIDDSTVSCSVIKQVLDEVGCMVTVAYDTKAALDKLENELPDIILLDLHMPDVEGLDFLRMLHDHPSYAEVPVILVSDDIKLDDVEEAAVLNAVDYLVKSEDMGRLVPKVKRCLSKICQVAE